MTDEEYLKQQQDTVADLVETFVERNLSLDDTLQALAITLDYVCYKFGETPKDAASIRDFFLDSFLDRRKAAVEMFTLFPFAK